MSPQNIETDRLKRLYELSMTLSGDPMDIFVHVARMIGEVLDVKVVCLSEIRGAELHFLSVYVNGEIIVNAGHCPLEITPCATVEASKELRIYDRVMERFPMAGFLRDHNAFAYCGFPSLDNAGKVVAVTCLLDDRPHEFSPNDQALLRVAGQRIGLEIARKQMSEERQTALEALRLSEARFRDIAEVAGEFIWEVDRKGRFTYLTERVAESYGYPAAALLGKKPYGFLFAEDIPRVKGFFQTVTREQRLFRNFEHPIRSRTGEEKWIAVSGVPIVDSAGLLTGYRGTCTDITQLKAAERAIQTSEAQFRLIAESIPDALWITDATLEKVLYVSPGYEHIWGRSGGALIDSRHAFFDTIHPDDLAKVAATFNRLNNDKSLELEYRIIRPDGSVAWIWDKAFAVFDSVGNVIRQVGIARDITARKLAEIQLHETEERLDLALRGADLGWWDWNVRTGTVFYSDRWISMLGYTREDIEPNYEQWARLVHPEDLAGALSILEAHAAETTPYFELEHRLLTKEGEWRWVWSSGRAWERDAQGQPLRIAGTHLDISGRKALEEQFRDQQSMLAHAQRLSTAGELAATIVHELNQPLGAIASHLGAATLEYAPVLKRHTGLRDTLDETQRLIQRASAVVRVIRDLVQRHAVHSEWLSIQDLLEGILLYLRKDFVRRSIRLNKEIALDIPPVHGDRVQLQQVILNLILNAMDAMDEIEEHRRNLTLQAMLSSPQNLVIVIQDSGPGLAPDIEGRLFEPFLTTKPNGMGLGLPLCRTITESHGGHIAAHSAPGQGARFEVSLPIAAGAPQHAQ